MPVGSLIAQKIQSCLHLLACGSESGPYTVHITKGIFANRIMLPECGVAYNHWTCNEQIQDSLYMSKWSTVTVHIRYVSIEMLLTPL